MKKLREGISKLSDDIEKVAETLEDRYTYPNLAKKLEQYRKRLDTLQKHKVVFSSDDPAEVDKEASHAYNMQLDCGKALKIMEKISAEDNVFDIIDALNAVDRQILYSFPTEEFMDAYFEAMKRLSDEESYND